MKAKAIAEFVRGYQFDMGDEGGMYTPTFHERCMIEDVICSFISDERFIRSALAPVAVEPVAWQWRYRDTGAESRGWSGWQPGKVPHRWWRTFGSSYIPVHGPDKDFETEERPLYASPVPAAVERGTDLSFPDALPDEQIRIWINACNHEQARQALRQLLAYRVRGVSRPLRAPSIDGRETEAAEVITPHLLRKLKTYLSIYAGDKELAGMIERAEAWLSNTRPDAGLPASEVIQPFAAAADAIPDDVPSETLLFAHFPSLFGGQTEIRVRHLRTARSWLSKHSPTNEAKEG